MKKKFRIFFLAFFYFLSACASAPAPQAAAPNVETIVAATYAAIAAQTEAAKPPATVTPFNTPTATLTKLPPTVTPTFTPIFILPSATASKTLTPPPTATPSRFACRFISQSPKNGVVVKPGSAFKWTWEVTNIGQEEWIAVDVKYFYLSGDKFHEKASRGLPHNVQIGKSVTLTANMIAPTTPGTYVTTWALRRHSQIFCDVRLEIIVQ